MLHNDNDNDNDNNKNRYTRPTEEHIIVLKSKPWYTQEHDQINLILNVFAPGSQIVAMPKSHSHTNLDQIICKFFNRQTNPYKQIKLLDGFCHDNCELLFKIKQIKSIYSGYALSSDGLWRFHSWGFDYDNKLVETTESRLCYYGQMIKSN